MYVSSHFVSKSIKDSYLLATCKKSQFTQPSHFEVFFSALRCYFYAYTAQKI